VISIDARELLDCAPVHVIPADPLRTALEATLTGRWRVAASLWRELATRDERPVAAWSFCAEAALQAGDFDLAIYCRAWLEQRGAMHPHLVPQFAKVEPIRRARRAWRAGPGISDPAERAAELMRLRWYDDAIAAALTIEDDATASKLIAEARASLGDRALDAGVDVDTSAPARSEPHPMRALLEDAA
jgi:hypothetical protein